MLSKIVHGERVREVLYAHHFDYGFSFDCDEDGVVNVAALQRPAYDNYLACLGGRVGDARVEDKGIQRFEHSYWRPGYGTCECGTVVTLDGDTRGEGIDCDGCGRIYNSVGQELKPREQWEEN